MCKFCVGMLTGMLACLVCLVVTFKLIQSGNIGPGSGGNQENSEPLPELSDPVPVAPSPASQAPPASAPESKVARSDPPPLQAMDAGAPVVVAQPLTPPMTSPSNPEPTTIMPSKGDVEASNPSALPPPPLPQPGSEAPPPPQPPVSGVLGQGATAPEPPPPVPPPPVDTLPPPPPPPPQAVELSKLPDAPSPPPVVTPPPPVDTLAPPVLAPPPDSIWEASPPELIPAPSVVPEPQAAPTTTPALHGTRTVQAVPAVRVVSSLEDRELPFSGTHVCTVRENRQVEVPASVRDRMGGISALVVAPAGRDHCLVLYTEEAFIRQVASKSVDTPPHSQYWRVHRRLFLSLSERVTMDAEGCITITAPQAQFAGIRKEAVLIGVGEYFELWDAERWAQFRKQHSAGEGSSEEQHRIMPPTEVPQR